MCRDTKCKNINRFMCSKPSETVADKKSRKQSNEFNHNQTQFRERVGDHNLSIAISLFSLMFAAFIN